VPDTPTQPLYDFIYGHSKAQCHVAVRPFNARIDGLWVDECDRLARRLRKDVGVDCASSDCSAAAQTIDGILLEFVGSSLPATHVFEVGLSEKPFAAIAVRLGLLQDAEAGAVIICGFIGKQLSVLPKPETIPVPPELFRAYQSALFLAFLAGWASRRGYSSKLKLAVCLLAKNPSMVKTE
jgi:hypothetical protein